MTSGILQLMRLRLNTPEKPKSMAYRILLMRILFHSGRPEKVKQLKRLQS
jgi:hypothetical protein